MTVEIKPVDASESAVSAREARDALASAIRSLSDAWVSLNAAATRLGARHDLIDYWCRQLDMIADDAGDIRDDIAEA